MWGVFFSSSIVSLDALFIGVSFGTERRVRLWHLVLINAALFLLCLGGFFVARLVYDLVDFEFGILIGAIFIAMGLWAIVSYAVRARKKAAAIEDGKGSKKGIVVTAVLMCVEAMFISIGLVFILENVTIFIPIFVAIMHLVYSSITFLLAKYLRRLPPIVGALVSGLALIGYGLMAILL